MDRLKVAIIDDHPSNFATVEAIVGDFADTVYFKSGITALHGIPDIQPDVILLDVEMPTMDGYDTCIKLKSGEKTESIPIMFVSSHDTLEYKIKGYNAGAEDYVCKPFNGDELIAKIKALSEIKRKQEIHKKQIVELNQKVVDVNERAALVMDTMGDMGLLLSFMEEIHICCNYEDIGNLLLETLIRYDINGRVEIAAQDKLFNLRLDNIITPLEADILRTVAGEDKIITGENFITLNYEHISLFVPNIPHEGHAKIDRVKNLAIQMTTVANERIKNLITLDLVKNQYADMRFILSALNELEIDENKLVKSVKEVGFSIRELAGENLIPQFEEKRLTMIVKDLLDADA